VDVDSGRTRRVVAAADCRSVAAVAAEGTAGTGSTLLLSTSPNLPLGYAA
jgi:hypothetical protein